MWLHNATNTKTIFKAQAQFKRRAILMSNLIVFNLDCRTTVDSNVEFNLVVPVALIETWNQGKVREVRWDNVQYHYHNVCIEFGTSLVRRLNQRRARVV